MNENKTMKELPVSEKPYEKCLEQGPQMLTDTELLAVILRTGSTGMTALGLSREILKNSAGRAGAIGSVPGQHFGSDADSRSRQG